MRNQSNLDMVNDKAYAKFGSEDIERKRNTNSIVNLQKLTHNNPNLDLVKASVYAIID